MRNEEAASVQVEVHETDGGLRQPLTDTSHGRLQRRCLDAIDQNKSNSRQSRIEMGLSRLEPKARLTHMTKILENDAWFRRNRSR